MTLKSEDYLRAADALTVAMGAWEALRATPTNENLADVLICAVELNEAVAAYADSHGWDEDAFRLAEASSIIHHMICEVMG